MRSLAPRASIRTFAAVVVVAIASTLALAGPPLVCWPFETGGAKSLPWNEGKGFEGTKSDYPVKNLADDTISLLAPDVPVIVRMETLRRAAIYASKNEQAAESLISRVISRAKGSGSKSKSEAVYWFDAGYLVEAFKQTESHDRNVISSVLRTLGLAGPEGGTKSPTAADGYLWVEKALEARGPDPEMEFAAALMAVYPRRPQYEKHLANAVSGAAEGSLLAKNLVSHFGDRGRTLPELRASLGVEKH